MSNIMSETIAKIKCYPVGKADCTLIKTKSNKIMVFDFGNMKTEEENDKKADLEVEIRKELGEGGELDVVSFSHLDKDHYKGFSEFFYLEHAKKYQDEERVKIKELWIPAAIILELNRKDSELPEEAKILRSEARHRLKNGKGIRVFSNPEALDDFVASHDLDSDKIKNLVTHSGELVPGFSKEGDGVEIFLHSPFSGHITDEKSINRNRCSTILHFTFYEGSETTKFLLTGDCESDVIDDLVAITKYRKNTDRLEWDIYSTPHHCNYKAINKEEKGENQTEPSEGVKELMSYGNEGAFIIASTNPIDGEYGDQPPHKEAAEYYKNIAENIDGEFLVTMEDPKKDSPKPIEIAIKNTGFERVFTTSTIFHAVSSSIPPRAG